MDGRVRLADVRVVAVDDLLGPSTSLKLFFLPGALPRRLGLGFQFGRAPGGCLGLFSRTLGLA